MHHRDFDLWLKLHETEAEVHTERNWNEYMEISVCIIGVRMKNAIPRRELNAKLHSQFHIETN